MRWVEGGASIIARRDGHPSSHGPLKGAVVGLYHALCLIERVGRDAFGLSRLDNLVGCGERRHEHHPALGHHINCFIVQEDAVLYGVNSCPDGGLDTLSSLGVACYL